MEMEMIVALNQDGIIGINNKIPWYIPEDLQRFKKITEGHIVIMGRKTYESLPVKHRPLKNRLNIVLSRQTNINESNIEHDNLIFTTMDNIYDIIKENIYNDDADDQNKKKIFIIGGSEIYNLFMNQCSIIHITEVLFFLSFEEKNKDADDTIAYFTNNNIFLNVNVNNDDFLISKNKNIKYRYITYRNDRFV